MTFYEKIPALTNKQLVEYLANATKTYFNCSGHTKAAMNEQRCELYKQELEKRNIAIPSENELLNTGSYNGDGSF